MTGFTGIPQRFLSPIAFDDMVELYNQLPWRVFSVSDGECFLMKSCWFAGVKCDMKAEGLNIEGGGCWALGARAALAKVRGRGLDWGWIVVTMWYCNCARVAREAEAHGGRARIGHEGTWVGG